MYRVVFVYAPYPAKEFKNLHEAIDYQTKMVAQSYIEEKKYFFSKWTKIFQKTLDKQLRVCYNNNGKREWQAEEVDPRESVRPLPMKSTARCVGVRYTNVNQCRFAEEMADDAYYKANHPKTPLD